MEGKRASLLLRKRKILQARGFFSGGARPHREVTARRRPRRRRTRRERRSPPRPHPGRTTFSAAARRSSQPRCLRRTASWQAHLPSSHSVAR
uniref:Uncharacterized protein n=1 Tax=Oryza glumipatula TaxID=40148 RepID=A0A0D9Y3R9_9ORYZ